MNAFNDPGQLRPAASLRASDEASGGAPVPAAVHTLRRTGRKSVRFEGWQLIEAAGGEGRGAVWYDLNLYRSLAGSIVVELISRRRGVEQEDLFRVKVFTDLASASTWLEAYRCAEDVPIPPGLFAADTALPWAVLHSVQLRQRLDRIETDYHALLSEVFAALDLTDPAEAPPEAAREPEPA